MSDYQTWREKALEDPNVAAAYIIDLEADLCFLKNQLRGIRDQKGLPLFDVAPIIAYFKKRDTREFLLKNEVSDLKARIAALTQQKS